LGIDYLVVTRRHNPGAIDFSELTRDIVEHHTLIINTTPLGTSPDVDRLPPIPYEFVGKDHLLYDLIYNPEVTAFLKKGLEKNAVIKNGYDMLRFQAERSWEIWNTKK
ncbi:MAG: shikimate dehydrogenase, partial [Mucilaginibacter polytrichastri]|nr:shikimate dehydrogenase [Mucilaginibacter polytrichastri]